MRFVVVVAVLGVSATARADTGRDDAISSAAEFAGGGQGDASYLALDARIDAIWDGVRLGFGARAVWVGGVFRRSDWAQPADAVNLIRYVEASTRFEDGTAAIAAGGLAPAHVGVLVDGYRAQLDDAFHTGVRSALTDGRLELGAEIDDVLDPALIAGRARVGLAPGWGIEAAAAIDPGMESAYQLGVSRRISSARDAARGELGAAIVGEPGLGVSGVGFGSAALDAGGVQFTAVGDVRGGSGTVGAAFGPLYRIERLAHDGALALANRARMGELDGVGAGLALGAVLPSAWLQLGMRARPGLPSLATIYGGTPIGRRVQAGVWLAASRADAAGTAEVRVAWNRRLFSALDAARLYQFDPMDPHAAWSVVGWLGVTSD